jgi:hypothetical protein
VSIAKRFTKRWAVQASLIWAKCKRTKSSKNSKVPLAGDGAV